MRTRLHDAREISERYVDSFFDLKSHRYREAGLLFLGPPGVGKTHLATAVLIELIERWKVRGRFVDFTSLIHQIQATFEPTSPESKHQVLDPVIDAEVLVLDELGATQLTEWVKDILYLVINTRYTRRLPTLFTTNYRLDSTNTKATREPAARSGVAGSSDSYRLDSVRRSKSVWNSAADQPAPRDLFGLLASRIGPALVSRLCEMARPVPLSGIDYRRDVKMHQHQIR